MKPNTENISEIELKQIAENICKNDNLSAEEKKELLELMVNEEMNDEQVLNHPVETVNLIVVMGGGPMLKKSIPQVEKWVKEGEAVSMRKIKDWYISEYKLRK